VLSQEGKTLRRLYKKRGKGRKEISPGIEVNAKKAFGLGEVAGKKGELANTGEIPHRQNGGEEMFNQKKKTQ